MATFKATLTEQLKQHLRLVLTVFLLWNSFHPADVCESEISLYTISQIVFVASLAALTALKFIAGMGFGTIEALLRIISVAAGRKRAALSGMLLLGVAGLSAAYFYLAVPVFEEWYRYLTRCAGFASLIAMELTVSIAFVPFYAWVAVSKNHHWLQCSCTSASSCECL